MERTEARINFSTVFPYLSRNRRHELRQFRKVNRFVRDFAAEHPNIDLGRAGPGLFVEENGALRPDVIAYARTRYPSAPARVSVLSMVKRLASAEIKERVSAGTPSAGPCRPMPGGPEKARPGRPALHLDDVPVMLRRQLETFRERASHGLSSYIDLHRLAVKAGYYNTGPLSPMTVETYQRALLAALAYMELSADADVVDLLALRVQHIWVDGREVVVLHNPHVDRYREAERAMERTKHKRAGYDSAAFAHLVSAACAIARFNGEFFLAEEFRKHYRVVSDRRTHRERKS